MSTLAGARKLKKELDSAEAAALRLGGGGVPNLAVEALGMVVACPTPGWAIKCLERESIHFKIQKFTLGGGCWSSALGIERRSKSINVVWREDRQRSAVLGEGQMD
uniref:Uncharacterized protein n=1 Tax=Oryza brachyantha TaxID=4533 RepID=J3MRP5_ORYBR